MKLAKRKYDKFSRGKIIHLGYISISNYEKGDDLFYIYDDNDKAESIANPPNELVLAPGKEYKLVIDYPLSTSYVGTLKTGKRGLTREQVVDKICKIYREIYQVNKVNPKKYGIWGHYIGDLLLHTLIFKSGNKLEVGVDS